MFERNTKALPPEFEIAVTRWREADEDVVAALARFRTMPNPVNRLAVIMAWAVLRVSLQALSSWAGEHPRASDASVWAQARSQGLQAEIEQVGLAEARPIALG